MFFFSFSKADPSLDSFTAGGLLDSFTAGGLLESTSLTRE